MNKCKNSKRNKFVSDILASIYYIRKQARQCPTIERISSCLKNHHDYGEILKEDLIKHLNKCIEEGYIKKYQNCGKDSFKLIANLVDILSSKNEKLLPSVNQLKTSKQVSMLNSIKEIFNSNSDSQKISISTLLSSLQCMDIAVGMENNDLEYCFNICWRKAVRRGAMERQGKYLKLVDESKLFRKSNYNLKYLNNQKLHSFEDKALIAQRPATPIMLCSICVDPRNQEELIFCHDCGRSGHPACLHFSDKLTMKVRNLKWQCIECKRCSICVQAGNEHMMLFCDSCDRGFHMNCCSPLITQPPEGDWICCICTNETILSSKKHFQKQNQDIKSSAKINDSFSEYEDDLGDDTDLELYSRIQQQLNKRNESNNDCEQVSLRRVVLGKYEVFSSFSSPFPQRSYIQDTIYFCEFCLQYFESMYPLQRHMNSCKHICPPGNEIYRDEANNISVFEVDGQNALVYCRHLCLLAKLFIDHKTVYNDVELFFFYLLTRNEGGVQRVVGYFSKEKYCHQNYNLCCITTFPQYQRCGYGFFLIAFSYLLSRKCNIPGSPERPLSYLGKLSYQSYWKGSILQYFYDNLDKTFSIRDISQGTGMCNEDIINTIYRLNLFKLCADKKLKISFPYHLYAIECQLNEKRILLDESKLIWTPFTPNATVDSNEDNSETFNNSIIQETPISINNTTTTYLNTPDVSYKSLQKNSFKKNNSNIVHTPLETSTPITKSSDVTNCYYSNRKHNINKELFAKTLHNKRRNNRKPLFKKTIKNRVNHHNFTNEIISPKSIVCSLRSRKKCSDSYIKDSKSSRYGSPLNATRRSPMKQIQKNNIGSFGAEKHSSNMCAVDIVRRAQFGLRSTSKNDVSIAEVSKAEIMEIHRNTDESVEKAERIYNTRCSNALKNFTKFGSIHHRLTSRPEKSMTFNNLSTLEDVNNSHFLISSDSNAVKRQLDEKSICVKRMKPSNELSMLEDKNRHVMRRKRLGSSIFKRKRKIVKKDIEDTNSKKSLQKEVKLVENKEVIIDFLDCETENSLNTNTSGHFLANGLEQDISSSFGEDHLHSGLNSFEVVTNKDVLTASNVKLNSVLNANVIAENITNNDTVQYSFDNTNLLIAENIILTNKEEISKSNKSLECNGVPLSYASPILSINLNEKSIESYEYVDKNIRSRHNIFDKINNFKQEKSELLNKLSTQFGNNLNEQCNIILNNSFAKLNEEKAENNVQKRSLIIPENFEDVLNIKETENSSDTMEILESSSPCLDNINDSVHNLNVQLDFKSTLKNSCMNLTTEPNAFFNSKNRLKNECITLLSVLPEDIADSQKISSSSFELPLLKITPNCTQTLQRYLMDLKQNIPFDQCNGFNFFETWEHNVLGLKSDGVSSTGQSPASNGISSESSNDAETSFLHKVETQVDYFNKHL